MAAEESLLEECIGRREREDDNIEYKMHVVGVENDQKLKRYATQIKWRILQTNVCHYMLGLTDSGEPVGLDDDEYAESMNNIEKILDYNDFTYKKLGEKKLESGKTVYELIFYAKNVVSYTEVRLVIAGSVDCSKSTTLGVLLTGKRDDGRGFARTSVFNYPHEVATGRTTSVAQKYLIFDADGQIMNHTPHNKIEDMLTECSKVITFYDLCGHEKYLKTTITGIFSQGPDYALIMVGANMGLLKLGQEHINICLSLGIPMIIVLSKIDLCNKAENKLKETKDQIRDYIRMTSGRKILLSIKNKDNVLTAVQNISSGNIIPVFETSNVTMQGMDLLTDFLTLVQPRHDVMAKLKNKAEFHITEIYGKVKGCGQVLGGFLKNGILEVGKKYWLGPFSFSKYELVTIKTIEVKCLRVLHAQAGSNVCVHCAKHGNELLVKKGMSLIEADQMPPIYRTFKAKILVFSQNKTTIRANYEPILNVNSLRTTVKLYDIEKLGSRKIHNAMESQKATLLHDDGKTLVLSDIAYVWVRMKYNTGFMSVGDKIFLSEKTVRMKGQICHLSSTDDAPQSVSAAH